MPYRPSVPRERLAAIGLRQNAGAGPQLQHMEHYPPAAARDAGFCAALTAGLTPDDDDFPPLGAAEEGDWRTACWNRWLCVEPRRYVQLHAPADSPMIVTSILFVRWSVCFGALGRTY